jgi:hypothetical protein
VTIRGVQPIPGIDGNAEGIDLSEGINFNAGTVRAEAERVAGVHPNRMTIATSHRTIVGKAVASVHPAVWKECKRVIHTMGVAKAETAEENFVFVGPTIPILVRILPNLTTA